MNTDADRRHFVRATGAGLVALAIPGWFTACRDRRVSATELFAEAREAAVKGRAVLVLHVEADEQRSADLGLLVGGFVMHGTDEEVACFAALELACATTNQLEVMAPDLAGRQDVRAVLVTPGEPAFCAVSGDPPPTAWPRYKSEDRAYEASLRHRNVWFARQLAAALGTDMSTLGHRADLERAAVGTSSRGELPHVDFVRDWPNTARFRAELEPSRRAAWIAALAASARDRWKDTSPAGSTWAVSGGCGVVTYAKPLREPKVSWACGLGHMPAIGRRFLHFYTAEELRG